MQRQDVQQFYNEYKNSMSAISRLENRLLKESYSYEKWYGTLLLQSKTLREIYAKNMKAYDEVIKAITANPDALSDEVNSEILTHIDFFISEGYRDYGITAPVIKAILPYWERKGHPGKIMDCHYFLGISLCDSHYYGEACNAFTEALKTYEDFMECPEPYWIYRMMCAVYYRLLSYIGLDRYTEKVLLQYYNEAAKMWNDPRVPDWMISPKKKAAIPKILRQTVCYAISRMLDQGQIPSEDILGVLVEEYEAEKEDETACVSEIVYSKFLRASGRISASDYENILLKKEAQLSKYFELGYTYGLWDFVALFDDETTDETFEQDKLFYINPAFAYVNYVLAELLIITDSEEVRQRVSHAIYRYFLELPAITADGNIDTLLHPILTILVARCDEEDLLIDCILNLLVHRQMPTAIHVTMVARLSRTFAHYIIPIHPEWFVGIRGLNSVDEVLAFSNVIEEFAYKSGLCHDLGKLTCTEVIKLQNRRILNEEFERIKSHPVAGASMLMNSESLYDYAFTALCHHIFDDGSRGYPQGAQLPNGPVRIFAEIITVCDSIDAMSDNLGRNYANPKNMDTVLDELSAEMGSRYSARIVELLQKNKDLVEEIKRQLYEERVQVHFDIYRQFVMPDTKFRPEDEKYVSPIDEEHLDDICNSLNLDLDKEKDIYDNCRGFSFMILNGRDEIFGMTMCELIDGTLWMRQMEVKREERRKGFGTMLIGHLENMAFNEKVNDIYVPDVPQGHYDKFAWQMGYTKCEREGWLSKKL